MTIRVLFADDQIPSQSDADNKRARDEIVRELGNKDPDIERKYEENHRWFQGLLQHLSARQGLEIIGAKTIAEAKAQLRQRDTFDVAVIDITWNGDPSVSSDEKADAGLHLIRWLSKENKKANDYKPAIGFSQNFERDNMLVADVLEAGALPVQKHYTELDRRMLGAAIMLLARVATPLENKKRPLGELSSDVGAPTLSQILSVPVSQLWAAGTAIVGAAAGLAGAAFWLGKTLGGHGP